MNSTFASIHKSLSSSLRYKTFFGSCPSKSAGSLAMLLVEKFEEKRSLGELKKMIVSEKLKNKYFIEDYEIKFNPIRNYLNFNFNCPKALFKVSVYKEDGKKSYSAILTKNAHLIDPVYESLLRMENKITDTLPSMAIPISQMKRKNFKKYVNLFFSLNDDLRKKVSEVIVDKNDELLIIFSLKGKASSAFLGKNFWSQKIEKLNKVLLQLSANEKIPSIVNMTNLKKVVVKFSESI